MRQSPFIWLGSGRAHKQNVAHKGRLLDQASRSGLPVPSGGILLDDFYRICLTEGLIEIVDHAVIISDPDWLYEVLYRDVRFPRMEKRVAVRSATAAAVAESWPGELAQLDVDFADAGQMAEALRTVWSAMNRLDIDRRDVLVMEMVAIETAGDATSALDAAQDEIRVLTGSEIDMPDNYSLKKLGAFQRASAEVPLFARRLQKLLRGLRRSFGKGDWHIDWADDGQICWLMKIY